MRISVNASVGKHVAANGRIPLFVNVSEEVVMNGSLALRWKFIKRKEILAAYQDRCALAVTLQASNSVVKLTENVDDPVAPPPVPVSSAKIPPQRVLWHGTINCDLDDLMLGVLNQNADMRKVKSSYVEDNGLDFFLLASIIDRTVDNPFDGLQVKWTVNEWARL
ncbi:unnamed protein product [Phytophthora fragariaefolia]|uniref:Unnamed protein product n=1 Tax=Phytophthora fragariaefolia TaxID=1490495 RepID=A0A9W6U2E5_9STRA|nr:unnamed protein product [Phytophthora fragariaefolia]